ncbi:MAG: EamA family transporter [Clostridia bacterium]|nr:EamA family transporter [Clostridia bacterium]
MLALVLGNALLLVTGQLVWKRGLDALGGLHPGTWMAVAAAPWTWMGLLAYAVATVLWFAVLSRLPLSMAYPMQSLAYALGVAAAWGLLHETVPPERWAGVVLILLGVALVAR